MLCLSCVRASASCGVRKETCRVKTCALDSKGHARTICLDTSMLAIWNDNAPERVSHKHCTIIELWKVVGGTRPQLMMHGPVPVQPRYWAERCRCGPERRQRCPKEVARQSRGKEVHAAQRRSRSRGTEPVVALGCRQECKGGIRRLSILPAHLALLLFGWSHAARRCGKASPRAK
jgi:hypothetical protein